MCIFTGNADLILLRSNLYPFFVRLPVANAWNCHSLYTAFSSNVGAWGMWACSLFLSYKYVFNIENDLSILSKDYIPHPYLISVWNGGDQIVCPLIHQLVHLAAPSLPVLLYIIYIDYFKWACAEGIKVCLSLK